MWWWSFFLSLGIFTFFSYLYESLKSPAQLLYHKWRQYQHKDIPLTVRYGKWAAITGSTDGIGKAYARQLAELGFNVVLIARNETKLKQVAYEIESEFGVEVFVVRVDFSEGSKIYDKLFQDLAKKPIGLVVNNVGIGHSTPGTVCTFTAEHLWDMINVNIGAATQLSRHFVELWYRNGTKGCIVNISSGLELQPCPYGAVYGASKAFLRSFTIALQHEVEHLGITVQLVSPDFVTTKINSYSSFIMKGNLFIPSADHYAKWAVNTLGKVDATTGYFWHGIQTTILCMIPWRLRCRVGVYLFKFLTDDVSNMKTASIAENDGQRNGALVNSN